jgi:hypothetical protein
VNQRYRKKLLLISIVLAIVVLLSFSYYLWCVGGMVGYVAAKLSSGKKTGVRGRVKSIVLPVRKYQLHLHHWFLAMVTLIICIVTGFYVITPQLFYGSMCGLVIQGLYCYDDWFHLIKRKIHHSSEQIILAVEENTTAIPDNIS